MDKKILIVEDSPTTLALLKEAFEDAGYAVVPAEDGEECLEKIKREKPGLVVLDTLLPGIDGFEVCRRIKGDSDTSGTKVIIITGSVGAVDAVKAREAGADDYCAKTSDFTPIIKAAQKFI